MQDDSSLVKEEESHLLHLLMEPVLLTGFSSEQIIKHCPQNYLRNFIAREAKSSQGMDARCHPTPPSLLPSLITEYLLYVKCCDTF